MEYVSVFPARVQKHIFYCWPIVNKYKPVQGIEKGWIEVNSVEAKVLSVNISEKRGEKKHNVGEAFLKANFGIDIDAHAGDWHRQVSLLSLSSFEKMRKLGADVYFGDFAENITVEGVDVATLPVGTKLKVGETLMELTQIGKECHKGCAIRQQVGTCVMPTEGVFTRVLEGGWVRVGDKIEITE